MAPFSHKVCSPFHPLLISLFPLVHGGSHAKEVLEKLDEGFVATVTTAQPTKLLQHVCYALPDREEQIFFLSVKKPLFFQRSASLSRSSCSPLQLSRAGNAYIA